MKKLIALCLVGSMAMSLVACGTSSNSTPDSQPASQTESAETEETSDDSSSDMTDLEEELSTLGEIDVDKNLFDVEITIPAEYVGETTQEELDKKAEESGVHSITLNEDGSATYVMSKEQHQKVLEETRASIRKSLDEMVESEDYPNITSIETNDDFTEFVVTTTSTELGLGESFSVLGFYMYGGLYGLFSGESPENIHVDFVNAESGEVIESSDSKDMGKS